MQFHWRERLCNSFTPRLLIVICLNKQLILIKTRLLRPDETVSLTYIVANHSLFCSYMLNFFLDHYTLKNDGLKITQLGLFYNPTAGSILHQPNSS